jgi:hypothetical protein
MLTELPGILDWAIVGRHRPTVYRFQAALSHSLFNGFIDQLRKLVWISLGFGHPGVFVAINARRGDFSQ